MLFRSKSHPNTGIGMIPSGTTGARSNSVIKTANATEGYGNQYQSSFFDDYTDEEMLGYDLNELSVFKSYEELYPYQRQLVDSYIYDLQQMQIINTTIVSIGLEELLGQIEEGILVSPQKEEVLEIENNAYELSNSLIDSIVNNPDDRALKTILTTMYN